MITLDGHITELDYDNGGEFGRRRPFLRLKIGRVEPILRTLAEPGPDFPSPEVLIDIEPSGRCYESLRQIQESGIGLQVRMKCESPGVYVGDRKILSLETRYVLETPLEVIRPTDALLHWDSYLARSE